VECYHQQDEYCASPALYRAFTGGIGTGKSWVGAFDLICRSRPGCTYMAVGPTYTSLSDSTLKSFLGVAHQLSVIDSSQLRLSAPPQLTLVNGAQVLFRSGDRPEMLRGPNLSGVWLDEASLMRKDVYDICIGRLREHGRQGWFGATFTPKGPTHWTYEVFVAPRPENAANTFLVRARTKDNPFITEDYYANLLAQYGDTAFAHQELDGQFVQTAGAIFPAHWFDFPGFWFHDWPQGIVRSVLYLDPSQGNDAKKNDYQAFVLAGFWPGAHNENLIYLECWAHHEPTDEMVARGVRVCKERRPNLWAYEVNATMGFLHTAVMDGIARASMMQRVLPVTHTSKESKLQRIRESLEYYLSRRQVRIRDTPGGRLLRAQLMDFGAKSTEFDDGPDAAAGAVHELAKLVTGLSR
jgi:phage terminase large subunit-like protein